MPKKKEFCRDCGKELTDRVDLVETTKKKRCHKCLRRFNEKKYLKDTHGKMLKYNMSTTGIHAVDKKAEFHFGKLKK